MPRLNRMLASLALCCSVIGLVSPQGQAAEPGAANPPALNEKELLAYKGKGRGSLTGQAFLGSASGKAVIQAGVPVYLIPATSFTRYWFDRNIWTISCSPNDEPASGEKAAAAARPTDCVHDGLSPLLTEKRLLPYIRTTRANPTGHFWFSKIPAGRYYILSFIEGGAGPRQEERAAGIAWLAIDLDPAEKAANLVVTNCKSSLC